jgi:excisionase family DNA binding protein
METSSGALDRDIKHMTPVSAAPEEREDVFRVHRLLEEVERVRRPEDQFTLRAPDGRTVPIPESVFYILERVAEVLARGDAVTVVPVGKEVTTQQAADLLNVSRQYLVRLLEDGKLNYTKVGKHRRLKIEDVLAFKGQRDRERMKSLDKLAELSQEFGGYGELK